MVPYILVLPFLAISSASAKISEKEYAQIPELFHVGNYDRCLMYGEKHFFCTLRIQVQPKALENPSKTWKIIEEVTSDRTNYRHDSLRRGVCIPEIFPNISSRIYQDEAEVRRKLEEFYDNEFEALGLKSNVTILGCHGQKSNHSYDVCTLLFGIAVAMYGLILLYATFNDVIIGIRSKEEAETFMGKLTLAISLRKNWQRLMTVETSTPDMQALRCLQGYRFYNLVYVILFHGVGSFIVRPKINPIYIEQMLKKPSILVYDMSYVMQIFFMISGFIFSYQFLLDEEKGIKMNLKHLIKSLIKRYIRLTPVLVFVIFFSCTWLQYLSNGPIWTVVVNMVYNPCRENWWTNLLYINNIVHVERICLLHTWYLAVNMQLYILSFILLCIISKHPKKVVQIFVALIIGHIICLFVPIYRNNSYHMITRPELGKVMDPRNMFGNTTFQFMHLSLYTNSAGVIAGLVVGYIFFKFRNKQLFTQKWHVILWWILSCGIPMMIILMDTWIYNNTPLYNASFGSTKKLIFAFGNGLLLLGMTKGEGWLLRWLCETSFIYVLGRLTYCAYLIHVLVQLVFTASEKSLNYISVGTLFGEPMEHVAMSFALAVLATLFVEMPIIELHKCLTGKKCDKEVILRDKDA